MAELTMSELRKRISEIMRAVVDDHTRYVLTRYGQPVAVITPYTEAPVSPNKPSAWNRLVALGEQIAQEWTADQNSTQILSDLR